jgi:hypothetical protein
MSTIATYNPQEMVLTFGGQTIDGFGDGTFIEVSRESDLSSDVVGAAGDVAVAKINDKRGNIKVILLMTSTGNGILTKAYHDYEAQNGQFSDMQECKVKNGVGKDIHVATKARVLKPANAGFSKNVEMREWTIRCADLDMQSTGVA